MATERLSRQGMTYSVERREREMAAADAEAVGIWGGSARDHDGQLFKVVSPFSFFNQKKVFLSNFLYLY